MSRRLIVFCTIAVLAAAAGCNGPAGNPSRRTNGLVPDGADLAASGKPGIAHFTSGGVRLYVVDETARSLIFSGEIPEGAEIVVRIDPDAEAVVAETPCAEEDDKPTVLAKPIDKTHKFSIWTRVPRHGAAAPTTQSIEIPE